MLGTDRGTMKLTGGLCGLVVVVGWLGKICKWGSGGLTGGPVKQAVDSG